LGRMPDARNMVTGRELATGRIEQAAPLMVDSPVLLIEGQKIRFPARFVVKFCGVIESQVPVGYEDEGGFHYGAELAFSSF